MLTHSQLPIKGYNKAVDISTQSATYSLIKEANEIGIVQIGNLVTAEVGVNGSFNVRTTGSGASTAMTLTATETVLRMLPDSDDPHEI